MMLYKNDLSEAIKKVKDPERKINIYAAVIIISTLWVALVLSQRATIANLKAENADQKVTIRYQANKLDSMTITQYHFVLDRLTQAEKVSRYKDYQDSLNMELLNIKKSLTSQ